MRTTFKTRKGRYAVIVTALVLAVVMAVSGTAAAYASYGVFKPMVCGVQGAQDGLITASTSQTIGFKQNNVFRLQQSTYYNTYSSYVRAFTISSEDMGSGTALQLNLDTSGSKDTKGKWSSSRGTGATSYTYKLNSSNGSIGYNDFNDLMSQISVTFNKDAHVTSGKGTVSIYAYNNTRCAESNLIATRISYKTVTAYTCKFIMYNYAQGVIDQENTSYQYKNSFASRYGQSYNDAMAEAKTNNTTILETPDNSNQGKFDFSIRIVPSGGVEDGSDSYGYKASVGYQLQEAGGSWGSNVQTYWLKENGSYEVAKTSSGKSVYTDVAEINLKDVDESRLVYPVTISDGLSLGNTYEVRGVIATDKKCDTPQPTNAVTFRYDPPNINNLKIGSTATTYGNTEKTMDLSMLATFADKNSDNPRLRATLYFTDNLNLPKQNDQGQEVRVDATDWIEFTGNMQELDADGQRVDVLDNDGNPIPITKEVSMLDEDGEQETTLSLPWDNFLLPANLQDVDANQESKSIGSQKCAFKLVVTDLNTNFSTSVISDPFTIDAAAPSQPVVYVGDKRTQQNPNYTELSIANGLTRGGATATVVLNVDGSTDDASGVREYQYAYYYLPSDAVNRVVDQDTGVSIYGANATAIFETLAAQTFTADSGSPSDARFVDISYTDWAATAEATTEEDGSMVLDKDLNGNAYGQITVGKDGFYRILVKAVDNANRASTVAEAFIRVDLTQPEQPEVVLAREPKSGETGLQPYDNSTYTDANVWLYAYSKPKTGKSIADFEFSVDGGLTWTSLLGRELDNDTDQYVMQTTVTVNKVTRKVQDYLPSDYLDLVKAEYKTRNNTETLPASSVPAQQNTAENHYWPLENARDVFGGTSNPYQIGLNVSGLGYNDYTSFLVRAVDSLGNVSPASKKSDGVIRTTPSAIAPKASMTHDNIEVALAIGNTTLSVDDITPDLKNRAAQKINNKYYWGQTAYTDDDRLKSFPINKAGALALQSGTDDQKATAYVNFAGNGMNWSQDDLEDLIKAKVFNPYIYIMTYGMRDEAGNKLDKFGNIVYTYDKTAKTYTLAAGRNSSTAAADVITAHKCTWGSDASCSGPCYLGDDCPYNKLEKLGYEVYKPEQVGVSGMSASGSAGLKWYHFDHYDPSTYQRYDNTKGYNGNNTATYDGENDPAAVVPTNDTNAYKTTYGTGTNDYIYTAANHWVTFTNTNHNAAGTNNSNTIAGLTSIQRRPMHMVANSKSGNTYNEEDNTNFEMDHIRTYGYRRDAPKEWMFTYNDQPAKKEISFTIDDANVQAHSNDGYGFMWNTTQRQRYNDKKWVISGYLFYIHNHDAPGWYPQTPPYAWAVAYIDEVDLNTLHYNGGGSGAGSSYNTRGNPYEGSSGTAFAISHFQALNTASNSSAAPNVNNVWNSRNLGVWLTWNASPTWTKNGTYTIPATFTSYGSYSNKNFTKYTLSNTNPPATGQPASWKRADGTGAFKTYWWWDNPGNMYNSKMVRHFHMVCNGNTTRIYVYQEGATGKLSKEQIQEKFEKDTNYGKTAGNGDFTKGFTAINYNATGTKIQNNNTLFVQEEDGSTDYTQLYTPRPKVNGERIGNKFYTLDEHDNAVQAATHHTDTNCYGFGFIVGANGNSHDCNMDSSVTISNVDMSITQVKSLSDVVTEPSWGNGKAKFIANITDDAVDDFTDPVMNSQIQWRLNNDQAKYIGWGVVDNQEATYDFLDSMAKAESGVSAEQAREAVGTYQPNDFSVTGTAKAAANRVTYTQQIDSISNYITTEYFEAYGLNAYTDGAIETQVQSSSTEKGHVYDINDVDNIVFEVDPEDYKSTSANPDFPAGRWYMVHDVAGYTNTSGATATPADNKGVEIDPRSGAFTDALETNVSLPGRYTYYFAPDKKDDGTVDTDKLNPANAVFDFVVNQAPVAQFEAVVDNNKLKVSDSSYDPDARDNGNPEAADYQRRYVTTVNDANVVAKNGNINFVLNGIVQWEWRFEILAPGTDGAISDNGKSLITLMSSDWLKSTNGAEIPINGKTLKELADKLSSADKTTATTLMGTKYDEFSKLPDKAVINVYLRVKDQSTYKVIDGGATKYTTCPNTGKLSSVTQVNVSASSSSTAAYPVSNPASSSMTPSKLYMYDTAQGSSNVNNKQITVERTSTHSQPGKKFGFVWKVGRGSDKQDAYRTLIPQNITVNGSTKKVYSLQTTAADKMPTWHADTMSFTSNIATTAQTIPVLFETEAPTDTGDTISNYKVNNQALTTSKGGKWIINYDFINAFISGYKDDASLGMILQLNEVVWGYSSNDVFAAQTKGTTPAQSAIINSSARTIFYKTDKNSPSPQVVTTQTLVGSNPPVAYAASEYLDVTDGTSFIQFNITGAEDLEGKAESYGFYFYDANDAGTETAWYKLDNRDGSGKLVSVDPDTYPHILTDAEKTALYPDQATKPASDTEINYRIRYRLRNSLDSKLRATTESQYRAAAEAAHPNSTADQQTFLENKVKEAVDKAFKEQIEGVLKSETNAERIRVGEYLASKDTAIPVQSKAATETIKIGKSAMLHTPTDSLNLAIFAYDNQTSRDDTATKANQTTFTRFEDIKLSVSNPMPPEIVVKNNASKNVAVIDNIGSYSRRETDQKDLKERLGDADYEKFQAASEYGTQESDLGDYSASSVTVTFKPKKAKFYKNTSGELVRGAGTGAVDYYEDIYAEADLTGKADIVYTGKYTTPQGNLVTSETDLKNLLGSEADKLVYGRVTDSDQLTFSHDGKYEITAYVVNGSGTKSVTRTVSFTIDQSKPDGMQVTFVDENNDTYVSNTWAQTVRASVTGATDTSGGVYEYSLDNGKNFTTLGGLGGSYTLTIPDKSRNIASGQYNLVIRARDRAGNTSAVPVNYVVKVDNTPPETKPVTLTASSSSSKIYDKYVLRLMASEGGSIWSVQGGVTDKIDTVVDVNYNQTVRLEFRPESGKKLNSVRVGGDTVNLTTEQDSATGSTYYSYTLTGVDRDYDVIATYIDDTVQATNNARTFTSYQTGLRMMKAVSSAPLLAADGVDDDGDDGDSADPADPTDPVEPNEPNEPTINTNESFYVSLAVSGAKSSETVVQAEDRDEDGFVTAGTDMTVLVKPASMTKVSQVSILSSAGTTTIPGENVTPVDGKPGWYSFQYQVLADANITIQMVEKDVVQVKLAPQDDEMGSFTLVTGENVESTANSREFDVAQGTTVTVQIEATANYKPVKLTANGTVVAQAEDGGSISTLVQVPVGTENVRIDVDFDVVETDEVYATPVEVITTGEGTVTPGPTSDDTVIDDVRRKIVQVPSSSSKTFTFTPAAGYVLGDVMLTAGNADPQKIGTNEMVETAGGKSAMYSLTTDEETEKYTLEVEFLPKTYAVTVESNLGGDVTVVDNSTSTPRILSGNSLKQVREGTKLTVNIASKDGYKIKKVEMIGISGTVGNVSSYTINALTGDVTVRVTFEPRTISTNVTTHKITASAEGVKDGDSQLHDQGYQFVIRKGIPADSTDYAEDLEKGWATVLDTSNINSWNWGKWQSSYTTTFEYIDDGNGRQVLEPNQAYTVFVRTRDKVGNVSDPVASTIYTLANTPGTDGVENRNDAGDTVTKSVLLGVNRNGNPNHTEYRVYVDTSDAMQTPQIANYQDGNEGWATLEAGDVYQFLVKYLEPGNRYYLQIESRNHDGKVTQKDPNEIASIMLSPAAPERGKFYFKEQPSPTGTVELCWEPVSAEVRGIQLFRDSDYLGDVYDGKTSFVDESMPYQYFADTVVRYSYAFINNGGVGSSQTAVSEEYYNALKKEEDAKTAAESGSEEEDEEALVEASAEINRMRALEKTTDNTQLFSETLTYPRYPLGLSKITASSSSSGSGSVDTSGTLIVAMALDDLTMRYQTYDLYLTAYEQDTEADGTPKVDENGKKVYKEAAIAPATWDPDHNFYDEDGNPITVTTTIYPSGDSQTVAARATWKGLNSHYGYKVHVKEVRSTGIGTYGATAGVGVEGLLEKCYYVNEDGFGYTYGNTRGLTTLKDVKGTWADGELMEYTGSKAWTSPLNEGVISFNETPYVKLAKNPYSGNTEDHLSTDGNDDPFILVSRGEAGQNGAGQDFNVKVIVYDRDAEDTDTGLYVSGNLGGLMGYAALDDDTHFAKTEEDAEKNPFTINFNARTMFTGVYGMDDSQLKLAAYDGTTEGTGEADIRVVVNQNTPIMDITDGPRQIIENGVAIPAEDFAKATAKIVSSPENASVALGEVAWMVQPKQYSQLFRTKDYNILREYLETGEVPAGGVQADLEADQATILSRLTDEQKANEDYVFKRVNSETGEVISTGVTQQGLNLVLLSVAPPIRRYVSLGIGDEGKAAYDDIRAKLTTAGKSAEELKELTLTEVDSDNNTGYWLELETALDNNLGGWLTRNEDGDIVPQIKMDAKEKPYETDRANTRVLKVVSPFGGNIRSQEISFVLRNHPVVKVKSSKVFDWVTVGEDEYKDYQVGGDGSKSPGDPDVDDYDIQDLLDQFKSVYNSTTEFKGLTKTVNEDGSVTLTDGTLKLTDKAYRILTDDDGNQVQDSSGKPTYQVYKLVDLVGSVTTKSMTVQLNADLGVNERFEKIGVLAIPYSQQYDDDGNSIFDPNKDLDDSVPQYYAVANNAVGGPVTSPDPNENYFVSISNLTPGQTYYLWSFYELADGTREYNRSYVAMTTQKAYSTVSFGFASAFTSFEEPDFPAEGTTKAFDISVQRETESGVKAAWGSITITPSYYLADEFGMMLKDENDEYIPLTGDDLENAVDAIQLADQLNGTYYGVGTQSIERVIRQNQNSDSIRLLIRNNTKLQHHAVLRLTMTVKKSEEGFCQLINGSDTMDVFLQDDEDTITEFKMSVTGTGISGDTGKEFGTLKKTNTAGTQLEYKYSGLQVGYSNPGTLFVNYTNSGTGDLLNITAEVYDDVNGKSSDDAKTWFQVSPPSKPDLLRDSTVVGTVEVHPNAELKDGIYTAWLIMKAENMKEEDWIRVKLTQVVGQSTLKGRIYITPGRLPKDRELVGQSTIEIYDRTTVTGEGANQNKGEPAYVGVTDIYGNYEIQNIENNKQYYIVVRRDGFITYDGALYTTGPNIDLVSYKNSHVFKFDLCLIGGDIVGLEGSQEPDGMITEADLNKLNAQYGKYWSHYPEDSEDYKIIKRCDFNGDGVVNSLDRAYLLSGQAKNFQSKDYGSDYRSLRPES